MDECVAVSVGLMELATSEVEPWCPSPEAAGEDVTVPLSELSDGELVARVRQRCPRSYGVLFDRHARSVAAAINMVLGNSSRCEDVVAEVFVAFWLSPEQFDPLRSSLLGYLRMKAKGRSVDVVRNESARQKRERTDGPGPLEREVDLSTALVASETTLAVRKAVADLSPDEREPIMLAFFGGLTYRSVAARLGLPEGTVKARIRSGLAHLRLDAGIRGEDVDDLRIRRHEESTAARGLVHDH
jgi:RNA polymerase sigma-70 factor (ECF subfamily)